MKDYLYQNDKEFKRYVDSYSQDKGISVDEALTHKIVKEYRQWLIESKKGKSKN